ncbi:MAG: ATP-binding cassette domain-containing protein, partial [Paracoccaceae bacterium]|nr:ATP-binding cassette domain-containing protein [Paracoccaceae bacterium]
MIKGVSFDADEHEVVSLLGASGSGKSTILRCINLLETPTRGEIFIDGEKLPLKQSKNGMVVSDLRALCVIRARLGMVFQQFNLWAHMTVLQNVIEGPVQILGLSKDQAIARAEALLDRASLAVVAMTTTAQAQDVLRVATEGAYPPFNNVTSDGELVGFDVDIAKALCVAMDRECEI